MKDITLLGIDIAKNVFQFHGVDVNGKAVFRKQIRRKDFLKKIESMPPCLIAMESCGGANHWGRQFEKLGHQVKLINPAYVKPFVKRNKNDANDAEAIVEAAMRPSMRFCAIKEPAHQDMQCLHRMREGLMKQKVASPRSAYVRPSACPSMPFRPRCSK